MSLWRVLLIEVLILYLWDATTHTHAHMDVNKQTFLYFKGNVTCSICAHARSQTRMYRNIIYIIDVWRINQTFLWYFQTYYIRFMSYRFCPTIREPNVAGRLCRIGLMQWYHQIKPLTGTVLPIESGVIERMYDICVIGYRLAVSRWYNSYVYCLYRTQLTCVHVITRQQ